MKYIFALILVTRVSAWAQQEVKVKENLKQHNIAVSEESREQSKEKPRVNDRAPSGSKKLASDRNKSE
ncbi:MAG TPA: hypothetical protein VNJ01_04935 [Bacteriovoracaceae bacterium]|nr:hypothetical protein [Bacteriovoracaceae bacterium]